MFLWLVDQDWCETIQEQMWGSTSLGRDGTFSYLKETVFVVGEHLDLSEVDSVMESSFKILVLHMFTSTLVRFDVFSTMSS